MQTNVNFRVDKQDKDAFEGFCQQVGMNVTTALNLFIKEVIRSQQLPFVVQADPFFSAENMRRLRNGLKELNEGKVVYHDLVEVADANSVD